MAINTNSVNKTYTDEVKKILNGRYLIQTNALLIGLGNDSERVNYQLDLGDYDSKTIIVEFQGFIYYNKDYKLNMLRVGNFQKFDLQDVSNFRHATASAGMLPEALTVAEYDFSQMAGSTILEELKYLTEDNPQTHNSNGSIIFNNTKHLCVSLPDHTQTDIYLVYLKYRAYSTTFLNYPFVRLGDRTNGALISTDDNCFNWSPIATYKEAYTLVNENTTYDCMIFFCSSIYWLEVEKLRIDRVSSSN